MKKSFKLMLVIAVMITFATGTLLASTQSDSASHPTSQPTQILSSEHRVIEIMLDNVEQMAAVSLAGGAVDARDAADAVDFLSNFADACHHAKEEDHLFQHLQKKGMSLDTGLVAVIIAEHQQGRDHVSTMNENIQAAAQGDSLAVAEFVLAATAYVELLREHIRKEDDRLFPAAADLVDAEGDKQLVHAFQEVEAEELGEGTHEKYVQIVHRLAKKYDVDASALKHEHSE